ncbi:unnamed protein product [Enterobius vermicularis]|uniref:Tubulin-specific chaperone A n=1 Tax=Enterobius vermicularis TaxID=51028 RepID=A0A0N4VQW4_ENTVE|nr:unnamed protein product [Enterobius vermicularis]
MASNGGRTRQSAHVSVNRTSVVCKKSYGSCRLNITSSKNIEKVERRFQTFEEEARQHKALSESLDVIEARNVVSSNREIALKDLAFVTAATQDHLEEAYKSYGDYHLNITSSKNIEKVEQRFQALEEETRKLKPLLESLDVIEPKNVVSSVREVALKDLAFVTAATRDHLGEAYKCVSSTNCGTS